MNQEQISTAQLAEELLELYDQFSEFSDSCAFQCESMVRVQDAAVSDRALFNGMLHSADWMRLRTAYFKRRLMRLQRRASQIADRTAGH
ncbi:hypothetical protein [Marinobacterium arenosum]|uniref:hypothetical protein n=1 Tax=Marinobacterium arenosum TaxID=2862496 RepID=UPI001C96ED24|nr:hypothetical protein [Marinobacterium arenosum]MBY4676811.1 hypothetical protein [Marinobacterium arenosum]